MSAETQQAIAEAKAVTEMMRDSKGWAVVREAIESRRREYAEGIVALSLDATADEVYALRVRAKLLTDILNIPQFFIEQGMLAVEADQLEAERKEAEEAAKAQQVLEDAGWKGTVKRLLEPVFGEARV